MAVPATAGIPDANGVFHACYTKSGATIRIIDPATTRCGSNETEIAWNANGPAGVAGPPGAPGPRGPSNAYVARNASSTPVGAGPANPTTIVSLALPSGQFVVNGTVVIAASIPSGTLIPFGEVQCGLASGGSSLGAPTVATVGGRAPTSYATLPIGVALTLSSPAVVSLLCFAEVFDMTAGPATITAVQVDSLAGP